MFLTKIVAGVQSILSSTNDSLVIYRKVR